MIYYAFYVVFRNSEGSGDVLLVLSNNIVIGKLIFTGLLQFWLPNVWIQRLQQVWIDSYVQRAINTVDDACIGQCYQRLWTLP
jgi:hypothetical protein